MTERGRLALILREADVRELLTMQGAMEAVETAFHARRVGAAPNLGRRRVVTEAGSLSVMAAALPLAGALGVKSYTAFGTAGGRHIFLLYSSNDGSLLAVMEADWLGRIRTGAATGIATRYLARSDATQLAVIGAGVQAWSQVEAICAVRSISQVRVYTRSQERRATFADRIRDELDVPAVSVESAQTAVESADIVSTVTTASEPVLLGDWLASGTHVNAVGSNWSDKREIDDETVRRASPIVVDSLEEAQREAGDLIDPASRDILDWARVRELADCIAGQVGRADDEAVTLYKSVGLAIEDVAVAGRVYALAVERGMGEELALGNGET